MALRGLKGLELQENHKALQKMKGASRLEGLKKALSFERAQKSEKA